MKKRLILGGLAAFSGVWFLRRRGEISQVAPDLRKGNPLLYMPVSVSNGLTLRILRGIVSRATEPVAGVEMRETHANGVPVLVYEPVGRDRPSGVLVWVHGGGRVSGTPVTDHRQCSYLAAEAGVLVVSVDYRLAPEHPFPAALDDIMTVLAWVRDQAQMLGVDPRRIAVAGASAGGGLAAEAAQRAFDEGMPLAFQLLVYPMLDDRTVALDAQGRGRLVWTPTSNRFGWSAYLGHPAGEPEGRPYAVASRRDELAGLPPAWIGVGDLDLFFAEDVDYAQRLLAAGVEVELDVVPGMYHGADVFMPKQPPSMQAFWGRMADALARAVG